MPARRTSWLKLYYHHKNDAVLNAMPDDEFRVWFKLLIHAADRDERRGAFREDAALALEVAGGDRDLLQRTLARLLDFGRLETEEEPGWYAFPGFADEQRRKPSDEPAETRERQRRSRARRRAETTAGGHAASRVTGS
ncbi:MAG TPA: hypothetical protein VFL91_21395, partial [Thermomicrobiales bacterium]|nr:hypothetical protein [Thermomicrobiales bacterium]